MVRNLKKSRRVSRHASCELLYIDYSTTTRARVTSQRVSRHASCELLYIDYSTTTRERVTSESYSSYLRSAYCEASLAHVLASAAASEPIVAARSTAA